MLEASRRFTTIYMNLTPDLTIFPMWLIFMSSLIVLNYLVFKPSLRILKERDQRTVGMAKDAQYFNQQTQIKAKEYEAIITEARNNARKERDEILKVAAVKQKQIISAARDEAEKHLKGVKTEIAGESAQARLTIRGQAQNLSDEIVRKLCA